jgi:hypothetical protein
MKHRQRRGDQHPQSAPIPLGIVGVRVADRSAGFIHVRHRFLSDRLFGCLLLPKRHQAFTERQQMEGMAPVLS